MSQPQIIVIGGGLSGLSAAHTILERGGRVLLLDKNSFLGGNSTKATSGINGAGTRTQRKQKIEDSPEVFEKDTIASAFKGSSEGKSYPLGKTLVFESADAVHWLEDNFQLDLSLVSRLGGHSFPRTHRGPERFPGMTITYALMEKFEKICETHPENAKLITKARATRLLKNRESVVGVEYETSEGKFTAHGPVVIATGGYGSDFGDDSILMKYRPDLKKYPTTNGDHCTGDGIKMATEIGAGLKDIEYVQVHPTGLVHPDDPGAKVKWLAAEALRGVGGIMLNGKGERFVDELGRRDFVSEQMEKNEGPFWLVLNGGGSKEIEWHCKHYLGRGLFRRFESAEALAKGIGVSAEKLRDTFGKFNEGAKAHKDAFGRKYFKHCPWKEDDFFHVGQITPVVHYCMGGLYVDEHTQVLTPQGKPIDGLWATGEVMGGTHGKNRLGGSSLLDCVVFGRVAGRVSSKYLLSHLSKSPARSESVQESVGEEKFGVGAKVEANGVTTSVRVNPEEKRVNLVIHWEKGHTPSVKVTKQGSTVPAAKSAAPAAAPAKVEKEKADPNKEWELSEVAKHNKETDCWVVVNGQVLDVTTFLKDHPGGKGAIMLFAGKDATTEFNLLHKPEVVAKYAPHTIIGKIKGAKIESKL